MIRFRLRLLGLLLALPFAVVLAQLVRMQLVEENHREYRNRADRRRAVYTLPRRGQILASDGTVLATNRTVFDLYFRYPELNPREPALRHLLALCDGRRLGFERAAVEETLLTAARENGHLVASGALASEHARKEPAWLVLAYDFDTENKNAIERSLGDFKEVFRFSPSPAGRGADLLFQPDALLVYEHTLARVSDLLALMRPGRAAPTASELDAVVEKTLRDIDRRARREARALERSGAKERRVEQKRAHARDAHLGNPWLLERDVPESVVTEVAYYPARYPGIVVEERTVRSYPEAEVFGTVTGRVVAGDKRKLAENEVLLEDLGGVPTHEEFAVLRTTVRSRRVAEGAAGLERSYDQALRGLPGRRIVRNDPVERAGRVREELAPEHGRVVQTTLDAGLQRRLYQALARRVSPLGRDAPGVAASAVVLDVQTGAVLANVGFPGIDPNRLREAGYAYLSLADGKLPKGERPLTELERLWPNTSGYFLDRPTLQPLFPGSIFKIVVAAAALEDGKAWEGDYTPSRRYPCHHVFALNKKLRCSAKNGHTVNRDVDLVEALQFSCNNYFYYLGLKHLEAADLDRWARAFGLGRRTGVDLHADRLRLEGGSLSALDRVSDFGRCHYAIGQVHVQATPLQVARMFAVIGADEPRLLTPYMVEPPPLEPSPLVPISSRTIATIREGLWRAAHHVGGTAAYARMGLRGFPVALKTGTAELEREDKVVNLGWLAGYAPAVAPTSRHPVAARIAFAVVVEETSAHGGDACAPVVHEILEHFAASAPSLYGPEILATEGGGE